MAQERYFWRKSELLDAAEHPEQWTAEQRQRMFAQVHRSRHDLRVSQDHRDWCARVADALWAFAGREYDPYTPQE